MQYVGTIFTVVLVIISEIHLRYVSSGHCDFAGTFLRDGEATDWMCRLCQARVSPLEFKKRKKISVLQIRGAASDGKLRVSNKLKAVQNAQHIALF